MPKNDTSKESLEFTKICFQAAKLNSENQTAFINSLRDVLTDSEITALQIGIAYQHMLIDSKLKDAMKATLANELYKEFNQQRKD